MGLAWRKSWRLQNSYFKVFTSLISTTWLFVSARIPIKKNNWGAGAVSGQPRAFAALAEDLGWVPRT